MAAAQSGKYDSDEGAVDWESQSDEDGDSDQEDEPMDDSSSTKKKTDSASKEDNDDFAAGELEGLKETAELYKSNIFKLEIDELLNEVAPNFDKHKHLLNALKMIKDIFTNEPDGKEELLVDYVKTMAKRHKITVPMLHASPPQDAKYKFQFQKPSSINVVGGYALKTVTKSKKPFNVDVAVEMPSGLFQEKDHTNNRYFYKRACYLAALTHVIQKAKKGFKLEFSTFNGDAHRPILIVKSSGDKSELDFTKTKCVIRIIPVISADIFPSHRLAPAKNNIRHADAVSEIHRSTPQYNASVLMDTSVTANLAFLYQHSKSCEAFKDAVILGRTWLHQRGLEAGQSGSGFSTFLFAMIMGYLLQGGLASGGRKLSTAHSSYQLLRGTIDFLGSHNFQNEPIMIGTSNHPEFAAERFKENYEVVIVDPTGTVNMAAHMTKSSLDQLQYEAKLAMAYFNDPVDRFDALFLQNVNDPKLRFDNIVSISIPDTKSDQYDDRAAAEFPIYSDFFARSLGSVLKRGLTDRISLIAVQKAGDFSWNIASAPSSTTEGSITIGLVLDPDNSPRVVDQGPDAQNAEACKAFREFWGDKSELRRFKDGSIVESVIWNVPGYEARSLIVQKIVFHLLERHFSILPETIQYWAGQLYPYLHLSKSVPATLFDRQLDVNSFHPVMAAYAELSKALRAADAELPLLISNVYPCDASLRYTSAVLPRARNFDNISSFPTSARYVDVINVIVQLERSSKWPDDIVALQKVKFAFYLKLTEILRKQHAEAVVVDDVANSNEFASPGYMDVYYQGFIFRCHLHVPHEETVLKSIINNKAEADAKKKERVQAALDDYMYRFRHQQLHTYHIQALSLKYPAFSSTVRLVKRWFGAHLLSVLVSDELIELICAHVFLNPQPWAPAVNALTGATRVLAFLASWEWQKTPVIVDIEGEMTASDRDIAYHNFTSLRQRSPHFNQGALFVATAKDLEGTRWSKSTPNKIAVVRMQMLAKASVKALGDAIASGAVKDIKRILITPMEDYHAVIHLKSKRCTRYFENIHAQQAILAKPSKSGLGPERYAGFDPVAEFVDEIRTIYGDTLLLFHDKYGGDKIGLVWDPYTTAPKQWRVAVGLNTVPADMNEHGVLVPADGKKEISKLAAVNFDAILSEIERLGAGLIDSITKHA
ncbi:Nrap protein [Dichotomocladium elegans]|nr:Nrap protein [Dichotomocladium elegans]